MQERSARKLKKYILSSKIKCPQTKNINNIQRKTLSNKNAMELLRKLSTSPK
jgi:phage FluMu protein Com